MQDAPVNSKREAAKGQRRLDEWEGSADFHQLNAAYKKAIESKPKWERKPKNENKRR